MAPPAHQPLSPPMDDVAGAAADAHAEDMDVDVTDDGLEDGELAHLPAHLGLHVRDQATLERSIMRQVDARMAERAQVDEQRRLDKTRTKLDALHGKLADVQRQMDAAPSVKHGALRRKMQTLSDEVATLLEDEAAILARLRAYGDPTAGAASAPTPVPSLAPPVAESERDRLIRLGRINPFATDDEVQRYLQSASPDATVAQGRAIKRPLADLEESDDVNDYDDDSASDPESAPRPARRRRLVKRAQKRPAACRPSATADSSGSDFAAGDGNSADDEDLDEVRSSDDHDAAITDYRSAIDDGLYSQYEERLEKWARAHYRRRTGEDPLEDEFDPLDEMRLPGSEPDVAIDKELVVPGSIHANLFGYQVTCVQWLWELHKQQVGGIIGDEVRIDCGKVLVSMGLGKTIQIIAFLSSLFYSDQLRNKPILIVCPATVMSQWVKEFHRWFPPFRVVVLHASGSGVQESKDRTARRGRRRGHGRDAYETDDEDSAEERAPSSRSRNVKSTPWVKSLVAGVVEKGHILLTTYTGVRIYAPDLTPVNWSYMVLDEGHKIRNPDAEVTLACKQMRTPHRIILSGTPIQNSLAELWSLFDFIYPGRLGTLPVFQTEFAVPINIGGYANASNVQVQTAYKCACTLRDLIQPYLLRRMKCDVAQDLPQKTEQVLFCKLTPTQRKLYQKLLASKDIAEVLDGKRNALFGIDLLRKTCNHPALVDSTHERDVDASGKLVVVRELLAMWFRNKHKVLLFTQTRQMLDIVEGMVKELGYTYRRMDGATPVKNRPGLVDDFNNDKKIFVFLLTTKVGGLGVNLTGADRLIIYDPDWNPTVDQQSRERAWRLGQTRHVTIYRLLTTGTIEEKIYHRQIFKQFLANKVLKDPKQQRFFKLNDLRDLFTLASEDQPTAETTDLFMRAQMRSNDDDALVQDLEGVSRLEQFHQEEAQASAANGTARTAASSSSTSTDPAVPASSESHILANLLGSNVHSAIHHDAIEASARPEFIIVEQEAQRVADVAVAALLRSRRAMQGHPIYAPTWTGRSGTAGGPPPRARAAPPASPVPDPSARGSALGSTKPMSSAQLLRGLRARNAHHTVAPTAVGDDDTEDIEDDGAAVFGTTESSASLVAKMRDFLASRDGHAPSRAIVDKFKLKIKSDQVGLFRKLLTGIATFQPPRAPGGEGVWNLKAEFQ
ncbi:hypothetical protein GGF32_001292 [Allomyces javanicus]|nr:hypothetical protein GGF32_001292 [Allomyces javanicus]